jgi:hypothetical protein
MQTEKLLLIVVILVVGILLVNMVISWFKPSFEKALMDEYNRQTLALQQHLDSIERIRSARVDTIKQIERRKTTIDSVHVTTYVYLMKMSNRDSLVQMKDSLREILGWNPKLLENKP